jgi:hypothetical protein
LNNIGVHQRDTGVPVLEEFITEISQEQDQKKDRVLNFLLVVMLVMMMPVVVLLMLQVVMVKKLLEENSYQR